MFIFYEETETFIAIIVNVLKSSINADINAIKKTANDRQVNELMLIGELMLIHKNQGTLVPRRHFLTVRH